MQNLQSNVGMILKEISFVFSDIDENQVKALSDAIMRSGKIVVCGAGRVGMAARGFAMRLGHLGLVAYCLGDATVPSIGKGDLFLISSGSGETQTIYDLVVRAKENKATIALITGNPDSRMGRLADVIVSIKAPSKTKPVDNFQSVQPMTTLNEQSLGIFFDALTLCLMGRKGETHETMWARHSNLE
jgi:6-phospho-3-hexuloisomerase